MKAARLFIFLFIGIFFTTVCSSQNVSVNVITKNGGIVQKGKTVFFEMTVNNTNPMSIVGVYKIKAQVSIPDSFLLIEQTGHQLPTGWEILSNNGGVMTISNGKDLIAPNDARTILIAVKGKETGGPVILSGQLSFSNGISPGSAPGSLEGDNPADNYSTSSCTVIK